MDNKNITGTKAMPINQLVKLSGMSRRAIIDLRAGRSRPGAKNAKRLVEIARSSKTPQEIEAFILDVDLPCLPYSIKKCRK